MSDDIYKQTRRKISDSELTSPASIAAIDNLNQQIQSNKNNVVGHGNININQAASVASDHIEVTGNVPQAYLDALKNSKKAQEEFNNQKEEKNFLPTENPPENYPYNVPQKSTFTPDSQVSAHMSSPLDSLLGEISSKHIWESYTFPSMGKFYQNIPGTIHIRAMTGGEEQILATPRYINRGEAIDLIFQRCIRENIDTTQFNSADRNHLLIYLRGISYTTDYDVELKCPSCQSKFHHVIDLNQLMVEYCPDDFGPDQLCGVLPESGFHFKYRLSTGRDDKEAQAYRERRFKEFGHQSEDDSILYKTSRLIEEISSPVSGMSIVSKSDISAVLQKLKISDVNYLRQTVNNPPFGVDMNIDILCPICNDEFTIGLPFDVDFFFPRKKKD